MSRDNHGDIIKSGHPLHDGPKPLDHVQIAARLSMIGNGAALSYWNGTIDVNLLEPGLTLSSRRVLASGGQIDAALFERANARLAELEAFGAIRKGPLGYVNTPCALRGDV